MKKEFISKYREVIGDYVMTKEEQMKNNTDYNTLEVSVRYDAGGMNYFSGGTRPRGYRVSVSPCSKSVGIRSSTMLGGNWESGKAFFIKSANRYNAKELQKIAGEVDFEKVAKMYADNEENAIFELVNKETPIVKKIEPENTPESKLLPISILKKFEEVGMQEDKKLEDMEIVAKYFNPTGAGTWYATSYNAENKIFSGYVSIFGDYNDEYGDFSLQELLEYKGRMGLGIELDKHFSGRKLSEVITK